MATHRDFPVALAQTGALLILALGCGAALQSAADAGAFDRLLGPSKVGGTAFWPLEAAGGECLLACEYCRFAQTTYRTNWPNSCIVGDIHRIAAAQVPRHDVFAAGFPCQSFSNAGRLGGFEDDRGLLFYEMLRIIRSCQPRAILLENVHGLLTRESALAEVLSCLATAGYPDVHYALLDASLLVPQRRQRCFLVGFKWFFLF